MIKKYRELLQDDLIIEILNINDFNYLIKEDFGWKYSFYIKDNKQKLEIDDKSRFDLFNIERELEKYLNLINPFAGNFTNFNNQIIMYRYEINITEHYITKFLRKKYEDLDGTRGIITPDLYEGINLIYKNKNTLTKYINTNVLKTDDKVLIRIKDNSKYSVIFYLNRIRKNEYNLLLVTQMKGVDFAGFNGKIIKLHPSGDR